MSGEWVFSSGRGQKVGTAAGCSEYSAWADPLLGEELNSRELESMGRAAKLAEAIAPSRPHAGVESQMANVVAGPFVGNAGPGSQGYAQGMTSLGYFLSCEEFPPDELDRQAVRAEAEIAPEFAA